MVDDPARFSTSFWGGIALVLGAIGVLASIYSPHKKKFILLAVVLLVSGIGCIDNAYRPEHFRRLTDWLSADISVTRALAILAALLAAALLGSNLAQYAARRIASIERHSLLAKIEERDSLLVAREGQIDSLTAQLEERDTLLTERGRQLDGLTAQLKELRDQVSALTAPVVAAPPKSQDKALVIEAKIVEFDPGFHGPRELVEELEAAYQKRKFAVLSVKNEGKPDLFNLVPEARITGSQTKIPCYWAKKYQADRYSLDGNRGRSLDLAHGLDGILFIGHAYGTEKLWARLPERHEDLASLPLYTIETLDGSRRIFPGAEPLIIGKSPEITVSFSNSLYNQSEGFSLGFREDGEPTITPA